MDVHVVQARVGEDLLDERLVDARLAAVRLVLPAERNRDRPGLALAAEVDVRRGRARDALELAELPADLLLRGVEGDGRRGGAVGRARRLLGRAGHARDERLGLGLRERGARQRDRDDKHDERELPHAAAWYAADRRRVAPLDGWTPQRHPRPPRSTTTGAGRQRTPSLRGAGVSARGGEAAPTLASS